MSNQHVLKIHPAPLADLLSGAKTAEVRRNDRGFQVGDTVRLMEVNPETGNWTGGADHVRTISHIQTGYGLPDGMCVLSYHQPFVPRNRLPGRLAIRAALPDVPGDMLDHGLFAALDAMGDQAEQQEATEAEYYCKVCGNHGCVSGCHPDYYKQQEARLAEVARESLRPENQRTEPVEPLRIPHPLEAQGAQAVDERAAFEHWASDGGLYPNAVERRGDQYKLAQTHSYWQAWQARASLCIKNGESKS